MKVITSGRAVTLGDKEWLGAGGEATVFAKGNMAFKIMHPGKTVMPATKFAELSAIKGSHVVKPSKLCFSENGSPVGYTMPLLPKVEPFCKLATRSYKDTKGITPQMIVDLLKALQSEVQSVHDAGCLVVDLNELNVMVENPVTPWLIDADSWQTRSHAATAIMESIRDPKVTGLNWSTGSDWFSFAVLAVQAYINIHPYKGMHPSYKLGEWVKRKSDGASVFDHDVRLPAMCNDFGVIPKGHRGWLESVLAHKDRSCPPPPEGTVSVTKDTVIRTSVNGRFVESKVRQYDDKIISASALFGSVYVVTASQSSIKVYKDADVVATLQYKRNALVFPCCVGDGKVVIGVFDGRKIEFFDGSTKIGEVACFDCLSVNGTAYAVGTDYLHEVTLQSISGKVVVSSKLVDSLSSSRIACDGCIYQNLLGKAHVTIPYKKGASKTVRIPQLDGKRVLDIVGARNVLIAVAESNGQYYRVKVVFSDDFSSFECHMTEHDSYSKPAFTTLANGICIALGNDGELEVFKNVGKSMTHQDPPFDNSSVLFSNVNQTLFTDGKFLKSVTLK